QGDNLRLMAKTFREERTDGTINLAAGKNFTFTGTSFALDEAAGNASAGVRVFAIVHREREEINSFPGFGCAAGGADDDVIAQPHNGRALRLFRQMSCFD